MSGASELPLGFFLSASGAFGLLQLCIPHPQPRYRSGVQSGLPAAQCGAMPSSVPHQPTALTLHHHLAPGAQREPHRRALAPRVAACVHQRRGGQGPGGGRLGARAQQVGERLHEKQARGGSTVRIRGGARNAGQPGACYG